jgi:hypothetical protein
VELPAELGGRDVGRDEQVGPADVPDEQRVTGEHGERGRRSGRPHHEGDGLRQLARRGEHVDLSAAQLDHLAVGQRPRRELGDAGSTEADVRTGRGGQLRWPDRKSAWKWVSTTSPIARLSSAAACRISSTSRRGSIAIARPVDASPTR